jgi:hypothetical protein
MWPPAGGGADTAKGPGKGKEKMALSRSASRPSSDTKTSSEGTISLVKRMRLVCSDGSIVDGVPLSGQQAPK